MRLHGMLVLFALGGAIASCSPPPAAPSSPASPPSAEPTASAAPESAPPAASGSASASAAVEAPPPAPALPPVEVSAVDPAPPEGAPPSLAIVAPAKNQVIPAGKLASFELKLTASGWKLGEGGKHLCVVLDRGACRRVDELARPLRLADLGALDEGQHVLSVLARRGSGEFVRPAGKRAAFASIAFFVGKRVAPVHKDGAPMLFFSPPDEGPSPPEGVLLDFYVANAEIAAGKYVVHASVGGPGIEGGVGLSLAENKPLRVRGARPGDYLARFSLFHFDGELGESTSHTAVTFTSKPVTGPFGEVTRGFRVTARK
jgi:hypothetical protein